MTTAKDMVLRDSNNTPVQLSMGKTVFLGAPKNVQIAGKDIQVVPLGLFDELEGELKINFERHAVDKDGSIFNFYMSPYPLRSSRKLDGSFRRVELSTKFGIYHFYKRDSSKIFEAVRSKLRENLTDQVVQQVKHEAVNRPEAPTFQIVSELETRYAYTEQDRDYKIYTVKANLVRQGKQDGVVRVFRLEESFNLGI